MYRVCVSVVRPLDRWFIEEVLPYERDLLNAAQRLCSGTDDARDLVQDVLARMLATEGWSAITNPRVYMLRMLRNLAIDRIRRSKIVDFRHFAELEDFDAPDDVPDQHRLAEDRQQLEALAQAIRTLPERCRIVFERCRIEGQSPQLLARDLGISVSTLEKRLARAVFLLNQALEPRRAEPYTAQDLPPEQRLQNGKRAPRLGG